MKNLNLNYAQISNTGVEILSEALKMDKSIVKVDLNSNLITEIGMISLGESMKMNNQIQVLKLSKNKLKDKGCELLVMGLLANANSSLRILQLDNNQIGNDGAFYIGKLLFESKSNLTHLYLDYN